MNHIQVLENGRAVDAVSQLKRVVSLSPKIDGAPSVDLLKQDSYVVVPVVHSGTLTSEILHQFFEAAQAFSQVTAAEDGKTGDGKTLTAVGLYSDEEQHCYQVPMTPEGLDELRGTSCGVVNFILYGAHPDGGRPDWLIAFDNQLYIAYGPEIFVQGLVSDISAAYQAFEDKIAQLQAEAQGDVPGYIAQEIERLSQYLTAALTKLKTDYVNAPADSFVNVL